MRCNRRSFGKWTIISASFILSTYWMYFLIVLMDLTDQNFPRSLPELKQIHDNYHHQHENKNLAFIFFVSLYLYEQTFCVPGCMFLNMLAGNFYGLINGWLLTSLLTAIGGTFSYLLSKYTICDFLNRCFKKHVRKLRLEYEKRSRKSDLATSSKQASNNDKLFIISIRMMPIMPGGIVNLIAPILEIKPKDYFFGTLFGTLPYNFILANVGTTLNSLQSLDDVFTGKNILLLLSMSLMMMLSTYIKTKLSGGGGAVRAPTPLREVTVDFGVRKERYVKSASYSREIPMPADRKDKFDLECIV